jgi:hypothetical protein
MRRAGVSNRLRIKKKNELPPQETWSQKLTVNIIKLFLHDLPA